MKNIFTESVILAQGDSPKPDSPSTKSTQSEDERPNLASLLRDQSTTRFELRPVKNDHSPLQSESPNVWERSVLVSPSQMKANHSLHPSLGALSAMINRESERLGARTFVKCLRAVLAVPSPDQSSSCPSLTSLDKSPPIKPHSHTHSVDGDGCEGELGFLEDPSLFVSRELSVEDWKAYLKSDLLLHL